MALQNLKKEVQQYLPDVEVGRFYLIKMSIFLEETHGFVPENTHFSEGGCADEINEPEYLLMQQYWGERFKFGGLAGYCHGGRTSIMALSHHVTEINGEKNLILLAGPHIGYHQGTWGQVIRDQHDNCSASCGSIAAVLNKGYDNISESPRDPLDRQQQVVENLIRPYLKNCIENGSSSNIFDATQFVMQQVNEDLIKIVEHLKPHFLGNIALITGITINTSAGNLFSPSLFQVSEK